MNFKYKFTVFTPCYNSEKTLHRVFDSLMSQTIDHSTFEWIVINDASTDNTHNLIGEYIKKADFDINYINLEKNQMIIKNYNLAIKKAQGELFVAIGHDDAFLDNALEIMDKYWIEYIEPKKDLYSGLTHHTVDQDYKIIGTKFPKDIMDLSPLILLKNRVYGEKRGFIQTKILRNFLFPENIDIYISEETNWILIGKKYKSFGINDGLVVYFENDGITDSLSRSHKIKYIKGSIYSTLLVLNSFRLRDLLIYNTKYFFMHFINLSRMSLHNKDLLEPIEKLNGIRRKFVYLILSPFGLVKALLDKKQGRV